MNRLNNLDQTNGYNVSDRYKVINTPEIVSQFEAAGFTIESVLASQVRNPAKDGYQKHLIRMSHPDTTFKIDGLRPEIILKNAYDGTTAFNLRIGVFRFLCANGLEIGTAFQSETVKHVGQNILERVLEAAERIKLGFPEMESQIEAMSAKQLNVLDAMEFAKHIGEILKPDVFFFERLDLLNVRRTSDVELDVFTILNVIQENALSGSYRYTAEVTRKENPESKSLVMRRGRKIKSLERTSKINTAVWDYALDLIA